jgi:hypothetical protein
MILQEKTYSELAVKIANKIIDKIKKNKDSDGAFTITYMFKDFSKQIKKNKIMVIFTYNIKASERDVSVETYHEQKLIHFKLNLTNKKELEEFLILHEVTHIIDNIISNLKADFMDKKSYIKVVENKLKEKEKAVPYLMHPMEFNALINSIKHYLESGKYDTSKLLKVRDYKSFLKKIIEFFGYINYNKELENSKGFKKKLLSRLVREGIIPDFIKKETFDNSVKKALKK